MSVHVTVSDKGQITLPLALRQRLGIEPGSRLALEAQDDGSVRLSLLARGAQGLFGLLAKPGEPVRSVEEMEAAVALGAVQGAELGALAHFTGSGAAGAALLAAEPGPRAKARS